MGSGLNALVSFLFANFYVPIMGIGLLEREAYMNYCLKGFDENYLIYGFELKTMNIRVFDYIRRKLSEFSDEYKCGHSTGCMYDTKNGKVDFEVRIPVGKDWFGKIFEIMLDAMLNKETIING